ncbi:MAG: polyphosphate kinase, partial [Verrucomicrobiales bacterium]
MDKHLLDGRPFRAKEISWLSFNSRVLEEAEDRSVPLMERLRFLGIYSSNLDEFFRVRVATLKRLARLGKQVKNLNIPDPAETLFEVHEILVKEAIHFNKAYEAVLEELAKEGIEVVDELSVPLEQREDLMEYFLSKVRPHLMPILLKGSSDLSNLRDHPMYLAVEMKKKSGTGRRGHALVEIIGDLPRFYVLPEIKKKKKTRVRQVMYLDDIIRFGLPTLFETLPYEVFDAYAIKFTRDSELEFDDDFTESILERMSEGLRARVMGSPVRMNYDAKIPQPFLNLLRQKLKFSQLDSLYPGARYHNRKLLMNFPTLGRSDLCFRGERPVPHAQLEGGAKKRGMFKQLQKRDSLLHLPYHSFSLFLDLLREAGMDPLVKSISLTQYRFASDSCVAAALMAAVRNGKHVTVLVEAQARFDEEANLGWAATYREAGIKVIMGLPGLKVHAKLCLIERLEGGRKRNYSAIGT